MRLAPLLTISLVVTIASAVPYPYLAWPSYSPMDTHIRAFAPLVFWLMLLVAALVVHGERGLWVLVGSPFALFFPVVWTAIYFFCECSIFQEG